MPLSTYSSVSASIMRQSWALSDLLNLAVSLSLDPADPDRFIATWYTSDGTEQTSYLRRCPDKILNEDDVKALQVLVKIKG